MRITQSRLFFYKICTILPHILARVCLKYEAGSCKFYGRIDGFALSFKKWALHFEIGADIQFLNGSCAEFDVPLMIFLHEVDFRVLINLAESNLSWIGSELESRPF